MRAGGVGAARSRAGRGAFFGARRADSLRSSQLPRRDRARLPVRRAVAWAVAVGVVAGGAVVANGPLAEAAPGPNPQVEFSLARVFDGTGHGTSSASFVNSANGFAPGDDTATDGVVRPTACGGDSGACRVTLTTPQWFAFPLPVLGGATVLGILAWGGLIVAVGLLAAVLRRRRGPHADGSAPAESMN